ncbi:MAG: hypothetical protein ACU0DM_13125, partial [Paracoccus sp. (in: a-proteobacteria)]
AQFWRDPNAAVPYRLRKVLTDSRMAFANRGCDTTAFEHILGRVRPPAASAHDWSSSHQIPCAIDRR